MEFLALTQNRYSVRNYSSQQVEKEKLDYILECARHAPSAVNKQPWHFIIVESEQKRKELQQCYPAPWFVSAPLYIVVCADASAAWTRPCDHKNHADIDAAITTEHICLAAAEQGLGTCWVCNFDVKQCKRILNLAADVHPVVILPLGYPANAERQPRPRKSVDEITTVL